MEFQFPGLKKTFELTGALIGWLAVILQLYLILLQMPASLAETITRFFSFFTILVNILVAVCFSFFVFNKAAKGGGFFSRQQTLTAIMVYIFIVGLVYNIILRPLWNPTGLQKIVDESLHTVIPLIFLLYWIFFVPKNKLQWNNVFPWLVFPLCYLVYTLVRGEYAGYYPYPFVDVKDLGFARVMVNCGWLFLVFFLFSLFFVGIGKIINRKLK